MTGQLRRPDRNDPVDQSMLDTSAFGTSPAHRFFRSFTLEPAASDNQAAYHTRKNPAVSDLEDRISSSKGGVSAPWGLQEGV